MKDSAKIILIGVITGLIITFFRLLLTPIISYVISPFGPLELLIIFILSTVIVIGLLYSASHLRDRDLATRLNHVEARLFYPPEISWAAKERDPKKNNPRKKLVCNTVTRKAYYVDDVIWDMIRENKIRWISEDDQDIEEWCRQSDKLVF